MKAVARHICLGSGLLASSLSALGADASLGLHTFAESMVYVNAGLNPPLYVAFLPNGNQASDHVLLLELRAGYGTVPNTWQYYLSSTSLDAAAAGMVYSLALPASNVEGSWSTSTSTFAVYYDTEWNTFGVTTSAYSRSILSTYYGAIGFGSTTGWSDPLQPAAAVPTSNGEIAMPFSYTTVASSQTCSISFNAFIDTRDYMAYVIAGVRGASDMNAQSLGGSAISAQGWSSGAYTAQTAAGDSGATLSGGHFERDFLGVGKVSGRSYPVVPAYTHFDLTLGTGQPAATISTTIAPLPTFVAGNVCTSLANQRLALNAQGLIPEAFGFLRIW